MVDQIQAFILNKFILNWAFILNKSILNWNSSLIVWFEIDLFIYLITIYRISDALHHSNATVYTTFRWDGTPIQINLRKTLWLQSKLEMIWDFQFESNPPIPCSSQDYFPITLQKLKILNCTNSESVHTQSIDGLEILKFEIREASCTCQKMHERGCERWWRPVWWWVSSEGFIDEQRNDHDQVEKALKDAQYGTIKYPAQHCRWCFNTIS